jgi:hypothetical protein
MSDYRGTTARLLIPARHNGERRPGDDRETGRPHDLFLNQCRRGGQYDDGTEHKRLNADRICTGGAARVRR